MHAEMVKVFKQPSQNEGLHNLEVHLPTLPLSTFSILFSFTRSVDLVFSILFSFTSFFSLSSAEVI